MSKASGWCVLAGVAMGAGVLLSSYAAEMQSPSSVNESAPDKAAKKGSQAGGTPVSPSKGPSSVSESAPQKMGKGEAAPKAKDSKDMPNLKTPSSVSESAPEKAADADKKGRKKEAEKNK